jgi:hypothetical protein
MQNFVTGRGQKKDFLKMLYLLGLGSLQHICSDTLNYK